LKTGALAAGALGISQFGTSARLLAAADPTVKMNITSRCLFSSLVALGENQPSLPNPYQSELPFNFSMNDDCSGIDAGVEAVLAGKADLGTVYRPLTSAEKARGLMETELDRIAYAVVVNKANPVNALTEEQVLNIFAGRIQNWKDVGGKDMGILIYRQKCGANFDCIIDQAITKAGIEKNHERLQEAVMTVEITDNQFEKISAHEMIITMAPRFFFTPDSKALKINGTPPTRAAEKNRNYPFLANVSVVTKINSSAAVQQFLSFLQGPHAGQMIEKGFALDWLQKGF
jgi:phosphate transport system substrate-binding protein